MVYPLFFLYFIISIIINKIPKPTNMYRTYLNLSLNNLLA